MIADLEEDGGGNKINNHYTYSANNESNTQIDQADKERTAVRKGEVGEYVINLQLGTLPKEYKHLADLMLKVDGKTTQIDHVVVSPYGLFVIETKNYKGWIYGSENQKQWTQTFNKNTKYKMANPIGQNNYHIRAIRQNLFDYKEVTYFSIISLSRNAVLKAVPKSKDGSYYVIFNTDVADTIRSKRRNKCLTDQEVVQIHEKLATLNITDPRIRAAHNKVY